jgi:hypothetical protein
MPKQVSDADPVSKPLPSPIYWLEPPKNKAPVAASSAEGALHPREGVINGEYVMYTDVLMRGQMSLLE